MLSFQNYIGNIFRIPDGKPLKNILEAIGGTPLVKLNKIPQSLGIECNVCKLMSLQIN